MAKMRVIVVGGFLGAGKTTLLAQAAKHFAAQSKRVGVITNDQANHLVDTQYLEALNVTVGEVAGGCFCCRFEDLENAASRLFKDIRPDVLLSEPVGSRTDISATVPGANPKMAIPATYDAILRMQTSASMKLLPWMKMNSRFRLHSGPARYNGCLYQTAASQLKTPEGC